VDPDFRAQAFRSVGIARRHGHFQGIQQALRSGSKICISPFGYGEICWRDFEAIIFGCLLGPIPTIAGESRLAGKVLEDFYGKLRYLDLLGGLLERLPR